MRNFGASKGLIMSACLFFLSVICASAADNGDIFAFTEVEGGYSVSLAEEVDPYSLKDTLVIPSSYNNKPVVEIGSYAFSCATISHAVIPSTVKTISNGGFHMSRIRKIEVPASVDSIGSLAFAGCGFLSEVVIRSKPENNTRIGEKCFMQCGALNSLILEEGVAAIGGESFVKAGLKSITIPKSLTYFGPFNAPAFYDSSVETVTFAEGTTRIPENAFGFARNLITVVLPEGVETIGRKAFYECKSLKNVNFPSSLKTIDYYAFFHTTSLTHIDLNEGLEIVGESNFSAAPLESLTLPSTLKRVLDGSFSGHVMEEFEIPASLNYCVNCAFMSSSLKRLTVRCDTLGVYAINRGVDSPLEYLRLGKEVSFARSSSIDYVDTLFVEKEFISNVKGHTYGTLVLGDWSQVGHLIFEQGSDSIVAPCTQTMIGEVIIPEGVTTLGDYFMEGLRVDEKYIKTISRAATKSSITLPKSVVKIGRNAFQRTYVREINLSQSLTSIADYAFDNCDSLKAIVIPKSVTEIGQYAFSGCDKLESVTFEGDRNVKINSRAFTGCKLLTEIKLPSLQEELAYGLFDGCKSLVEIQLPPTLTTLGHEAFKYCTALSSIVFPASLSYIGSACFYGCTDLKDVYCQSPVPPTVYDNSFSQSSYETATLHVPADYYDVYSQSSTWEKFLDKVQGIEEIGADEDPEAEAVYYNLQGVRVAYPQSGQIYIMKIGNKVKKVRVQ